MADMSAYGGQLFTDATKARMVSVLAFIVAKFSLQDVKQTMLKYFVASLLGC